MVLWIIPPVHLFQTEIDKEIFCSAYLIITTEKRSSTESKKSMKNQRKRGRIKENEEESEVWARMESIKRIADQTLKWKVKISLSLISFWKEATLSENTSGSVDQKNMPEIQHLVYFKVYYWEIVCYMICVFSLIDSGSKNPFTTCYR